MPTMFWGFLRAIIYQFLQELDGVFRVMVFIVIRLLRVKTPLFYDKRYDTFAALI